MPAYFVRGSFVDAIREIRLIRGFLFFVIRADPCVPWFSELSWLDWLVFGERRLPFLQ